MGCVLWVLWAAAAAPAIAAATPAPLTPEQEVEAWNPIVDVDASAVVDPAEQRQSRLTGVSVAVPLAALALGSIAGGVVGVGSGLATGNHVVGVGVGLGSAFLFFDLFLGGGLWLFLPDGMPAWTVPIAVIAADLGLAAGAATGIAAFYAYDAIVYAGSDCHCGVDLLVGMPLLAVALTATATTVATVLTTHTAGLDARFATDVAPPPPLDE